MGSHLGIQNVGSGEVHATGWIELVEGLANVASGFSTRGKALPGNGEIVGQHDTELRNPLLSDLLDEASGQCWIGDGECSGFSA